MSFPKKGKSFPRAADSHRASKAAYENVDGNFATNIAAALNSELGKTSAHIKIVAAWTGANERTVKNWFAGHYGPSGDHLVVLIGHSNAVLNEILSMANRHELIAALRFEDIEKRIVALMSFVRSKKRQDESIPRKRN